MRIRPCSDTATSQAAAASTRVAREARAIAFIDLPADVIERITHGALSLCEGAGLRLTGRALRDGMAASDKLWEGAYAPKNIAALDAVLDRLPNLTGLDLRRLPVRDVTPERIAQTVGRLQKLTSLEGLPATDAHCAALSGSRITHMTLRRGGWNTITDAGLPHLNTLPLRSIELFDCKGVTDAGLAHLTNLQLKSLNLSGCQNFTDAGLAHLANLRITHFRLIACSAVTDAALAHLKNMPLEKLDISNCYAVTDAGLAHVAKPRLTSLRVYYCSRITDAALSYLKNASLKTWDARGTGISPAAKHAFEKSRGVLQMTEL